MITITPPTLPDGALGVAYSQQLTASGGPAPTSSPCSSGTLPAGLTLSQAACSRARRRRQVTRRSRSRRPTALGAGNHHVYDHRPHRCADTAASSSSSSPWGSPVWGICACGSGRDPSSQRRRASDPIATDLNGDDEHLVQRLAISGEASRPIVEPGRSRRTASQQITPSTVRVTLRSSQLLSQNKEVGCWSRSGVRSTDPNREPTGIQVNVNSSLSAFGSPHDASQPRIPSCHHGGGRGRFARPFPLRLNPRQLGRVRRSQPRRRHGRHP